MPKGPGQSDFAGQASAQLLAGIIEGIGRGAALTVEVFLHSDFGCYYVGCGVGGLIAMFLFLAFLFPQQNPYPMFIFMGVYAIRWGFVGIRAFIQYWRGKELLHSRYNGHPYLCRLLPEWKEVNVKYVEAIIALAGSYGLHFLYRPLGYYLMAASGLVLLRILSYDRDIKDRAIDLNDSIIDQELLVDRFREMRPK
ncbi:MAG TPA: hypothetical protein VGG19_14160 [Tepidisphaeraceae bacterium]|jgi:hypothetical protein